MLGIISSLFFKMKQKKFSNGHDPGCINKEILWDWKSHFTILNGRKNYNLQRQKSGYWQNGKKYKIIAQVLNFERTTCRICDKIYQLIVEANESLLSAFVIVDVSLIIMCTKGF